MRSISISNLRPDMVVGRNIYSSNGELLLAEGLTLTSHFIKRLLELGLASVYVEDEESAGIDVKDTVPEHTRLQALGTVSDSFASVGEQENVRDAELPTEAISGAVDELMAALLAHDSQVYNIVSVKTYDEYTYQHCVNVAVLSMIIAMSFGLPETPIMKLGIGAMLHDIGKMYVPLEILNKQNSLEAEEFEIVKKHSRLGYDVVKHDRALSPLSTNIVLRHHERLDGSGYPDGIRGDKIHLFSRIVAATDVYDAETSNRPYRQPIKPAEAVRMIVDESGWKFDSRVVGALCKHIPPYPIGSGVLLSSGEAGLVVSYDSNNPSSPVVRVLFSKSGDKLASYHEVDLMWEPDLAVVDSAYDGSDESLLEFYEKPEAAAA